MYICDVCRKTGQEDCIHCSMGSPCLGCRNYDEEKDNCRSDGTCTGGEKMTDRTISIFSINDVLDALSMVPEGSAEDLASELTGLSIDSIWELSCREYIATDIEWETDGEDVSLPAACIIKAHDEDDVTERLSGKYGWLIRKLDVEKFDRNGKQENYAHALEVLFNEGWNYYGAAELLEEVDVKSVSDMELVALSENYKAR